MYFPEHNCPFYRVTYLSNYSPHMTPDNKQYYSLLCETSHSEHKPVDGRTVIDETIRGLVDSGMISERDQDDIVDTWVYHADYSYPTPSVERDSILEQAIPFLEQHNIYSRGRFGMWKYEVSNTDHTLMQGVELINRMLLNEPEQTIGIKYESTLDGRNAARHERSALAGSGDPKRTQVSVPAAQKTSPDAAISARPGGLPASHATSRAHPSVSDALRELQKTNPGGPGDRAEAHISEEELGVTAPRDDKETTHA